ncbi:hypothetical protein BEL07_15105 [Mycolicibacterium grossiae]|uniref:Uncharacterized protein n=1 Tax=Mycolicibacterium grossiae TaxID=1552759 RepID=A0A1E8Q3X2_9MYCO|nr:hypothetical protein BEL07_15105 [Mycolicibacterium grossiae]
MSVLSSSGAEYYPLGAGIRRPFLGNAPDVTTPSADQPSSDHGPDSTEESAPTANPAYATPPPEGIPDAETD